MTWSAAFFTLLYFTPVGILFFLLSVLWMVLTGPIVKAWLYLAGIKPKRKRRKIPECTGIPFWSNCWWWALWHYCRNGGILLIQYSVFIPVWHVQWTPRIGGAVYEFHPVKPSSSWRAWLTSPCHLGYVRKVEKGTAKGHAG